MRVLMRAGALAGVLGLAAWGASCGGDGGTTDPGSDPARIQATVRVDGTARSGVTVRLYASGGTTVLSSQTTNASGVATFNELDAGSYDVEVQLPEAVELGEGEAARKAVSVTTGQTASVSFDLVAISSGDVVEVRLTSNNTFDPATLTIEPGTTVRWVNDIARFHTVTPDGHTEWTGASLSAAGATFTHTFNNTGEFPYFCEPHQSQGMTGTITVQ